MAPETPRKQRGRVGGAAARTPRHTLPTPPQTRGRRTANRTADQSLGGWAVPEAHSPTRSRAGALPATLSDLTGPELAEQLPSSQREAHDLLCRDRAGELEESVREDLVERLSKSTPSAVLVLRAFDLLSECGPCVGLSRRERFARARKLHLSPPPIVGELLDCLELRSMLDLAGESDPADALISQSLWHGQV